MDRQWCRRVVPTIPQNTNLYPLPSKLNGFVVVGYVDIDECSFDGSAGIHDRINTAVASRLYLDDRANGQNVGICGDDPSLHSHPGGSDAFDAISGRLKWLEQRHRSRYGFGGLIDRFFRRLDQLRHSQLG